MPFAAVEEAARALREGRMIVLVDDEDRENEGDLCVAAEHATPEAVNFMARHGRGLVCLTMTEERLRQLDLPPMVSENTAAYGTAFCVSVDARSGITTGISAADRAATIQACIHPGTRGEDLARPGHVFPLQAAQGGVLRRAGQTEASVDLARIAGLYPAGVICEIMNEDGTMARMPELQKFAKEHGLPILTVQALIEYRLRRERFVHRASESTLPTPKGEFRLVAYENELDRQLHLAVVLGEPAKREAALVRVHSECLTGEVFHSARCDCRDQLDMALDRIAEEGAGVLVYLRQEGRGIGLKHKLAAYALQDKGQDTVEANESLGFKPDQRDFGVGAQILSDLGISKIRVLTNNPRKLVGLAGFGLEIVERIPLEAKPSEGNIRYLTTKKNKLGHLLSKV
jgi:3,4-dihydroxy 2-butanone 4-phosphate synthase / GTP cyclohydrolase II